MFKKAHIFYLVLTFSVFFTTHADALILDGEITGGSAFTKGGVFQQVYPPISGSVGNNNFQSNNLFAFDEDQDITLGSNLLVNYNTSGSSGSILSGTEISSHYVVFDPRRSETVTGWIDFNSEILGIIKTVPTLNASDHLSSILANYYTGRYRGLENAYPDLAWIDSSNPNRVNVSMRASSPGDSFRVITRSSPHSVPEPMTMLLFGTGLFGAILNRLRK